LNACLVLAFFEDSECSAFSIYVFFIYSVVLFIIQCCFFIESVCWEWCPEMQD